MSVGCVYLTVYLGDKMPQYYIGSSTVERVEAGYHGPVTSKAYASVWKMELEANPDLFSTFVLSTHPDRHTAMLEEKRLQVELDVVRSTMFINRALAQPNGFFGPSQKGVKKSAEHSKKIGLALTGRTVSETTRAKSRASQKLRPPASASTRYALSAACSGKLNGRALVFKVTSPNGTKYTVHGGLRKFCNSHSISLQKMLRHLGEGPIPQHVKGPKTTQALACTGWSIERS